MSTVKGNQEIASESSWRAKFEAKHLVILAVSLAVAWSTNYFVGGPSLIDRLSFKVEDPAWVPENFAAKPLVGNHYFGDFEILVATGATANPYQLQVPGSHLPTGQLLLSILSNIPYELAFMIYLAMSVAALLLGAWSMARIESKPDFNEFLRTFVIFSIICIPTIVDLDRGNFHSLSLGLVAYYLGSGLRKPNVLMYLALLIAASVKPYMLIFALAFISKKYLKHNVVAYSTFILLNLILFNVYTGNAFGGVIEWLSAMAKYSGAGGIQSFGLGQIAHSGSLAGSLHRIAEYFIGSENSILWLNDNIFGLQIASVCYIAICVLLWHSKSSPIWMKLFALFSIVSVAQLGSMAYGWGWISFATIAYLYTSNTQHSSNFWRRYVQIIVAVGLIPTWILLPAVSGDSRQIANYLVLSPLIIFGICLMFMKYSNPWIAKVASRNKPK